MHTNITSKWFYWNCSRVLPLQSFLSFLSSVCQLSVTVEGLRGIAWICGLVCIFNSPKDHFFLWHHPDKIFFSRKSTDIFFISSSKHKLCCGFSLEYPQYMFSLRNRKKYFVDNPSNTELCADSRRAVVGFWRKNVHKYWLTAYRTKPAQGKCG